MTPHESSAAVEDDEFAQAEANASVNSGYASMDGQGDVADPREHRRIPIGTACTLGILGFDLNLKKPTDPYLWVDYECVSPAEYADESTKFGVRMGLSNVISPGAKVSQWGVTSDQLYWLAAAVITKSTGTPVTLSDPAVKDFFRDAYAPFRDTGINADNREEFFAGLVALCNAKLKGETFDTAIGIKKGTNGYSDRQTIGHPVFARKNARKAS